MPFSYNTGTATPGQTTIAVTFEYLSRADVAVKINGTALATDAYEWTSASTITLDTALSGGEVWRVERTSNREELVAIFSSGALDHRDINRVNRQLLYVVQELFDVGLLSVEEVEAIAAELEQISTDVDAALVTINNALVTINAAVVVAQEAAAAAAAAVGTTSGYGTLAIASAISPETAPGWITTLGFSSIGDGGNAIYRQVVSEPAHAGKFSIVLDDELTTVWYELVHSGVINVKQWGVKGDGTLEDISKLEAAVQYAVDRFGGGTIYFPTGTYLLPAPFAVTDSFIQVRGAGEAETTVILDDAVNDHAITFDGSAGQLEGVGLFNITVDGNGANQTAGHTLRLDNIKNSRFENVTLQNGFHYGLGAQEGVFLNNTFRGITIINAGADGVDFKDKDEGNKGNVFTDIKVDGWGVISASTAQAAFDIRGENTVLGLSIRNPVRDDANGLRYRTLSVDGNGDYGARYSSVQGVNIDMGTKPSAIGVIMGAAGCQLQGGVVKGGLRGATIINPGCSISGVTFLGQTNEAIYIDDTTNGDGTHLGEDAMVIGCNILGASSRGIRVDSARAKLIGNTIKGCTTSIQLDAGSTNTEVIGGYVDGPVGDSGTGTRIRDVVGCVTEVHLESSTIDLTTTGSKVVNIAHGLGFTPNKKDVIAQIIAASSADATDYVLTNLRVETVTSTNVQVRARCTTASATPGTVATIGIRIKVKNG